MAGHRRFSLRLCKSHRCPTLWPRLEALEQRVVLSLVSWVGGGDGQSWNDPLNWNVRAVPTVNDDVVIDVATNPTVTTTESISIQSLISNETLKILSGTFKVTAGTSRINAALTVGSGATLAVEGAGTSLTEPSGTATLNGANLIATAGGVLALPTATSYAGTTANTTIQASGAGSRVDLSGLTSLSGGTTYYASLSILAQDGGVVNLSALPAIATGAVRVTADGVGSAIGLSCLASFADSASLGSSWLVVRNGGAIQADRLTSISGAQVRIENTGTLPTAQITSLVEGWLIVQDAAPNLNKLTKIDGLYLSTEAGGVISLPGVTTYLSASKGSWIHAVGAGSRIDLSHLTSLSGGTEFSMSILAQGGGAVDLSAVPAISVGSVQATADGASSMVDLSQLTSFIDTSRYKAAALVARNGGAIRAGQLTSLDSVSLVIDGTSTLPTAQITSLVNGSLEVHGAAPDLGGLTTVNGSHLRAWDGGVLSLPPTLTDYTGAKDYGTLIQAHGAGSRVNLSRLTHLSGGTSYSGLSILAEEGGVVDLSALPALAEGSVQVTVDGAGSAVDLSRLILFAHSGSSAPSSIAVSNKGTVGIGTFATSTSIASASVTVGESGHLLTTDLHLDSSATLLGSGTITGKVTNASVVRPGNPVGILTVDGDYVQTDTGSLEIELGGVKPGELYDRINVTGTASLGGTLKVALTGGFKPEAGNGFRVATFASRAGDFATYEGLAADGAELILRFDPTGLSLFQGQEDRIPLETAFDSLSGPTIASLASPVTLSGHISAGSQVPPGHVSITLNGVTRTAAIDPAAGTFSSIFPTSTLTPSGSPYPITYSYAGVSVDAVDFSSATDTSPSLAVLPAPAVQDLRVNDGGAQRSMVTSLRAIFNEQVRLDAGAFQLVTPSGVQPVTMSVATSSDAGGATVADLTFSGPGISGGSLEDGQYTLIVQASQVHNAAGQGMAADAPLTFFRLFGDYAGDGINDNLDLAYFRMAYNGTTRYIPHFDYDGDGLITGVDTKQVLSRRYQWISVQDIMAPVVTYTDPMPGFATRTDQTVTGRVMDDFSGVASLVGRVDAGPTFPVALDDRGDFRFTAVLPLGASADGVHTVHLIATDLVGNVSAPYDLTFVQDTTAPWSPTPTHCPRPPRAPSPRSPDAWTMS